MSSDSRQNPLSCRWGDAHVSWGAGNPTPLHSNMAIPPGKSEVRLEGVMVTLVETKGEEQIFSDCMS